MHIRVYPLKLYIQKLPIALMGGIAIILNVFCWVWISIQIPQTGNAIFLHYNVLFGVDSIGNGWRMYVVPLIGSIIILGNLIAGWLLYRLDRFMAQVLMALALVCQIFIVIATFLLIFLNV